MAVRTNERGKLVVDFYLGKKRVVRQCDRIGCTTKRAAKEYIRQRKASYNSHGSDNFITVEQAMLFYRDTHLKKEQSNHWIVQRIINKFGEFKITELKRPDVYLWITNMLNGEVEGETKYAISTIEKHLSYFNAAFNYCIKMERLDQNPITKIDFRKEFKKKNRRNETMTYEQFKELEKLFENERWYIKGILQVLWSTGMRIGEVLNLKWSDLRLEAGVFLLAACDVKEGKIRVGGLEKDALDLLTGLKKDNDKKGAKSNTHVFSVTHDQPLKYQTWWKNYTRIVKDTEFERFTTHDQRHCWNKRYRQGGADKEVAKIQLGHSTDSMYHYYNDIDIQEVAEMVGFYRDKIEIFEDDVKIIVDKMKENGIPLGTLHAAIREQL